MTDSQRICFAKETFIEKVEVTAASAGGARSLSQGDRV